MSVAAAGCGQMDNRYYVNVAELMREHLPSPRLRRKVIYDKTDGFLQIIGVECET